MRAIEALLGEHFDLLELISQMPDMWMHLVELRIDSALCPGKVELETYRTFVQPVSDPPEIEHVRQVWGFYVFAATTEQKETLKKLTKATPVLVVANESPTSLTMRIDTTFVPTDDSDFYIPDLVDSVTGRLFFIPDYEKYVAEPAAQLMILYCLGMLARYYPDVWMGLIERNVLASELLDSVLNVIARKFPLLILDQLTELKHYLQVS